MVFPFLSFTAYEYRRLLQSRRPIFWGNIPATFWTMITWVFEKASWRKETKQKQKTLEKGLLEHKRLFFMFCFVLFLLQIYVRLTIKYFIYKWIYKEVHWFIILSAIWKNGGRALQKASFIAVIYDKLGF